jgi:hypothetical protein
VLVIVADGISDGRTLAAWAEYDTAGAPLALRTWREGAPFDSSSERAGKVEVILENKLQEAKFAARAIREIFWPNAQDKASRKARWIDGRPERGL